MKKIVALIDFTPVSVLSAAYAVSIARSASAELTFLTISQPENRTVEQETVSKMKQLIADVLHGYADVKYAVHYGDFFETVGSSIQQLNGDLLLVGTHGISVKGSFAGSNIFRLLQICDIPALIVQAHSVLPGSGFKKILIPLTGKVNETALQAVIADFGKVFHSVIHILGFYQPLDQPDLKKRADQLAASFHHEGLKTWTDLEQMPAGGLARSVVEYSDIEETDIIVLAAGNKQEGYFDTEDQENILLNRLCKPVLCL